MKVSNALLIVLLCSAFGGQMIAQSGVSFFVNTNLDRMKAVAERENKDIFIDTYTKWCVPCKKLDKIFTDRALADYFNANFVNVKFDMESEAGKALQSKYDIFFMPTLLFLDKHGNVKIVWDRGLIGADALLDMAMKTQNPQSQHAPIVAPDVPVEVETVAVKTSAPQKKEIVPPKPVIEKNSSQIQSPPSVESVGDSEEKILYVMNSGEGPPDFILYEEAYFRLQLMDGSHTSVAREYLKSQTDWLTSKNMRFLNDFLFTTNSEEFRFFVDHLTAFEKELGKTEVQRTISILANERLFRGFPRPDLNEAMSLYSLMQVDNPAISANRYYLDNLISKDSPQEYIAFAESYIEGLGDRDHQEMNRLAMTKMNHNGSDKNLSKCISIMNKAAMLAPDVADYQENLALMYFNANNKEKALESIQHAFRLAKAQNRESDLNDDLLRKIEAL